MQACGDKLLVRLERNGQVVAVTRQTWTHYDYQVTADNQCRSNCTGRFTQFPVLHGYAVTINRSQGMTLSGRLHIELPFGKRLPSGLIYTALSRAQSLGQLSCNRMTEATCSPRRKSVSLWNGTSSGKKEVSSRPSRPGGQSHHSRVALSRVRHLADLTLERPVNYWDVAPNALNDRLKQMGY